MPEYPEIPSEKKQELTAKLKEFLKRKYLKAMHKAILEGKPFVADAGLMGKYSSDLLESLLYWPDSFYDVAEEAVSQMELPDQIRVRFSEIPDIINIRDLRAENINRFICTEGVVRKASEIRPEIISATYLCPACGEKIEKERQGNFLGKPTQCDCGNKFGFKQVEKKMIDTRWMVIEEPFEMTEGERPSQVTIMLKGDMVTPAGRRMSDPGNRLKIIGVLKDIPKVKTWNVKLDFYLDANHMEPTEIGWEKLEVSKEDEKEIKKLAKNPKIYEMMIDSLAPSLYGMREIKESIILQLFGGVRKILKDRMRFRGDIHILLIGDPASGKSQLMKLVPQIVPRGKYVSGKGTTTAGLTATVSKDEQFMGGWVLEAGALVLANKGMLAVDEFEKMSQEDQVAMHEGMEQGSISIAKASIVATLPAETAILAGGNPKFSRFDTYRPIAEQITITDTLLGRFDLKFILRDLPNPTQDKKIVDHIMSSRTDEDYVGSIPVLDPDFIRKYIAYAKENCKPVHTKETGRILKHFYVESRRKAQKENTPIPITLRQFEGMLRLSEASAKIRLSNVVKKEDAQRAMRLMQCSLVQLGSDPETGLIDVDKAEGSTSFSERNQIHTVMDLINELSQKKKEMAKGEIEELAKKQGVKNPEDIIERLKREGMLFEPSPGYIQKV